MACDVTWEWSEGSPDSGHSVKWPDSIYLVEVKVTEIGLRRPPIYEAREEVSAFSQSNNCDGSISLKWTRTHEQQERAKKSAELNQRADALKKELDEVNAELKALG